MGIQWILASAESTYVEQSLGELISTLPWIEFAPTSLMQGLTAQKREWTVETVMTGTKGMLFGLEAELVILEAEGIENRAEGEVEYRVRDHIWIVRDIPGREEVDSLRAELNRTVGTDISFLPIAVSLYGRFPGATRMLIAERSSLNGIPVRDSITLQIRSPGAKSRDDAETPFPLFMLNTVSIQEAEVPDRFYAPPVGFRERR
jgi:hypothetical protein